MGPGTVALPCGELGRYHAFTYCLAALTYPAGSRLGMAKGLSIPSNLNTIIRNMVGDWVWLIGDDHVFQPDIIQQLGRNDVDVVVPLCVRRQPPFSLVVFKGEDDDGYVPFAYDEIPDGLFEVHAAGTAGMLIRRHVLEAVGDPWFENADREQATEDLEFCRKIRQGGFRIHADPTVLLGHIGTFTAWPRRVNGDLGIFFDMGETRDGALNSIFVRPGARDGEGASDGRAAAAAAV